MSHLTRGNTSTDSYLVRSECLDDSKEGWASSRKGGTGWGGRGHPQFPSGRSPHFLPFRSECQALTPEGEE